MSLESVPQVKYVFSCSPMIAMSLVSIPKTVRVRMNSRTDMNSVPVLKLIWARNSLGTGISCSELLAISIVDFEAFPGSTLVWDLFQELRFRISCRTGIRFKIVLGPVPVLDSVPDP